MKGYTAQLRDHAHELRMFPDDAEKPGIARYLLQAVLLLTLPGEAHRGGIYAQASRSFEPSSLSRGEIMYYITWANTGRVPTRPLMPKNGPTPRISTFKLTSSQKRFLNYSRLDPRLIPYSLRKSRMPLMHLTVYHVAHV